MKSVPLLLVLLAMMVFALPAAFAQDAPDYGHYRLIDVQELDLFAGPGRTAAHLAPDGVQFAHANGGELCIYNRSTGPWAQDRCFALPPELLTDPEDMRWSPEGRYLTLPTYEALRYFRDSDIRVLDTVDGAVMNLTDDGIDTSLLGDYRGNLDLAPRWLDDDTLLFVRYATNANAPADAGLSERMQPAALYSVDVPAAGAPAPPEPVAEIAAGFSVPTYLLAVDRPNARVAYNVDIPGSAQGQSLWQIGLDDGDAPALLVDLPRNKFLITIDYAADGRTLMVFRVDAVTFALNVELVATETSEVTTLDPANVTNSNPQPSDEAQIVGAGWSPTGSAIAYVVRDRVNPDASGLYIASAPDQPGQLILPGEFSGTTCCQRMPIDWAQNDIIMIGRGSEAGVLLVQVGPVAK